MIQFYLFGFSVQIQPLFWLTTILLGGGLSAKDTQDFIALFNWTMVVFISILIHELGHAFAGRRYGARPSIALHGVGGVTLLPGTNFSRWQSIWVSAAGPAASIGLGVLLLVIYLLLGKDAPDDIEKLLKTAVAINFYWVVINLLPILPMDGGQIFRDLVGPRHIKIALWVGGLTGVALCYWAFSSRQYYLAIMAGVLAWMNFSGIQKLPGGVIK